MKHPPPSSKTSAFRASVVVMIVFAAVALWWAGRGNKAPLSPNAKSDDAAPGAPTASPSPAATTSPTATPAPASSSASIRASTPSAIPGASKTFDTFQLRPFAVARSSGKHEWTKEDGKDPDVILDLAHNELEVQRLMEENNRIRRRQLVYRKELITDTIQRARAAGEPVRNFILPGLDGKEYSVEVTQDSVERDRMAGSLAGHLKDRPNSMVSIGFKDGYESFNIFSPDDGVYLTADAREPGEVIVKEIDPDKYAPPTGDAPDFVLTK